MTDVRKPGEDDAVAAGETEQAGTELRDRKQPAPPSIDEGDPATTDDGSGTSETD